MGGTKSASVATPEEHFNHSMNQALPCCADVGIVVNGVLLILTLQRA